MIELDLANPAHARMFLRDFRMPNGDRILYVDTVIGKRVYIIDATDDQITQFAVQVFNDIFLPSQLKDKKNQCYCEQPDLH
jgi:hypothetical protein